MFITIKTNLSVKMIQIFSKTCYYNFWTTILEMQFLMNKLLSHNNYIQIRIPKFNSTSTPWRWNFENLMKIEWSEGEIQSSV
jgi:hypothetical protein